MQKNEFLDQQFPIWNRWLNIWTQFSDFFASTLEWSKVRPAQCTWKTFQTNFFRHLYVLKFLWVKIPILSKKKLSWQFDTTECYRCHGIFFDNDKNFVLPNSSRNPRNIFFGPEKTLSWNFFWQWQIYFAFDVLLT